jgi:hypothetical protein
MIPMNEVTESLYEKARTNAVSAFQKNRKVANPIFGTIKITPEGFEHLEWKNRNHKRPMREAFVRLICFMDVPYILQRSHIYQEYRETCEEIQVKKNGRILKERKIVRYY